MRDLTDKEKAQEEHAANEVWADMAKIYIKDWKRISQEHEMANEILKKFRLFGAAMVMNAGMLKLQTDFADATGQGVETEDLR